MGKVCGYCGQNVPDTIMNAKKKAWSDRIKKSISERKKKGLHVGRPSTTPTQEIIRLRKSGMKMREISLKLKVSIGAVQRAIAKGE